MEKSFQLFKICFIVDLKILILNVVRYVQNLSRYSRQHETVNVAKVDLKIPYHLLDPKKLGCLFTNWNKLNSKEITHNVGNYRI